MTAYEPGTVCVATVRGVPNVRVMRLSTSRDGTPMWSSSVSIHGQLWHVPNDVTDVRPLAVLDLDDPRATADLLRSTATGPHLKWLADQIEAQTKSPKPEEPQGLGAVVEDSRGRRWVRADSLIGHEHHWRSELNANAFWRYDEIDAVRVLSPGVTS